MITCASEDLLLTEWIVKEHHDFFKDLDKLDTSILTIFYKKKQKIRQDPIREKHLAGGANCYREAITNNIRLIYFIEGMTIWLLTIGRHDWSYNEYLKRLHSLRTKHLQR